MQKNLDESKPIVMRGLKGMKSTRAEKKFKNMAAYEKWEASEDYGNWTVQQIANA